VRVASGVQVFSVIRSVVLVGDDIGFEDSLDYSATTHFGIKAGAVFYQGLFSIKCMKSMYKPLFI
jgi:hypothetical protein